MSVDTNRITASEAMISFKGKVAEIKRKKPDSYEPGLAVLGAWR
uniref:Uncharacterized protein n=1 Tax=Rheinheimera sp. BAL341 TaxID=1708203 RepID=A0A486XVW9_9GAMM